MSQADHSDSTAPPGADNPFPTICETVVGAALVKTTDARDLHRSLEVGRDFSNWIKGRLARYGFVENIDYVKAEVFARSGENPGGRPKTEYHLTLDTAKEIAMVENNARGRAVRRYFIECEQRAQEAVLPADAMELIRRTDGIARQLSGRLAKMQSEIDALAHRKPVPAIDFGETVSAYQIIEMAGIKTEDRQRGTAQMVTNRMLAFCAKRQVACIRTPACVNPAEPYRFPYAIVCEWLMGDTRGLELIRNQVERAKARKVRKSGRGGGGQASLSLVPPYRPSA